MVEDDDDPGDAEAGEELECEAEVVDDDDHAESSGYHPRTTPVRVQKYNAVTDRLDAYARLLDSLAPRFDDDAEGWKIADDRSAREATDAVRRAIVRIADADRGTGSNDDAEDG